jgi:hypothetical protein
MVVPRDELSLKIRDWYYAGSEGQVDAFLNFFLKDSKTTYFGTDPGELWYGFEEIETNLRENFRIYGKWTIMSKNLLVQELGEIAIFSDDVELSVRHGENSIAEEARVTGVLVRKDTDWKLLQVHLSFGIPNQKLLPD